MPERSINNSGGIPFENIAEEFLSYAERGDTGQIAVRAAGDTGVSPSIDWAEIDESDVDTIEIGSIDIVTHDVQQSFNQELIDSFESEPIESGYSHLCESIFLSAILEQGRDAVDWIQYFFLRNYHHPALSSEILTCVGRLPTEIVDPWGLTMAIGGLGHPDIRVRDAAVCSLENWATPDSLRALYMHKDPVSWLDEHIQQILEDYNFV